MMRLLTKFLLLLYLMMLSWHTYAHQPYSNNVRQQVGNNAGVFFSRNGKEIIYAPKHSRKNNGYDHIKAIEIEEDDDPEPYRKQIATFNYFYASVYARAPGYTSALLNKYEPCHVKLSCASLSRCILHCVIRI